jgi:hypothetical protein
MAIFTGNPEREEDVREKRVIFPLMGRPVTQILHFSGRPGYCGAIMQQEVPYRGPFPGLFPFLLRLSGRGRPRE